jgi:hypothetical protein
MIGEERFDVVEPGRSYLLSDGTKLKFLGRDSSGNIEGITNEELIQVLIHRLTVQLDLFKSRESGMAITELEAAEHWLWRWEVNRRKTRERSAPQQKQSSSEQN